LLPINFFSNITGQKNKQNEIIKIGMHSIFYKPAPIPLGDEARVEFLRSLNILDTKADISFDRITEAASTIMHAPIACVSLVDSDRQWIKSKVGMDISETSRDHSFCSHVIAQSDDGVFVVCDALEDERFKYHDLVMGEPNIRFYAAVPLIIDGGSGCNYKIGTLCIVDFRPRNLDDHHHNVMETLAQLVVTEINNLRGLHSAHYTHFMQQINEHANTNCNDDQPRERAHEYDSDLPSLADIEAEWKATLAGHGIELFPSSQTNLATCASPASSSSFALSAPCSSFDSDADEVPWRSSFSTEEDFAWWSDGTPPSSAMDCN
jgi:hypothetical protein